MANWKVSCRPQHVALFLISLPLAWPTSSRPMTRFAVSLADLMEICHQGGFLGDPYLTSLGRSVLKTKCKHNFYIVGTIAFTAGIWAETANYMLALTRPRLKSAATLN